MAENTLDRLVEKVDKIHITVVRTEETMQSLKNHVSAQNGRIGHLEENSEKGIAERAVYEERLRSHMSSDEKSQDQLDKDVRSISKRVYIAVGASVAASALMPYIIHGF